MSHTEIYGPIVWKQSAEMAGAIGFTAAPSLKLSPVALVLFPQHIAFSLGASPSVESLLSYTKETPWPLTVMISTAQCL